MGKFEKAQAVLEELAVGLLVSCHLLSHLDQFLLPFGSELVAHVRRDLPVVAVLVQLAPPLHQASLLGLQSRQSALMVLLFVRHALLESNPEGLGETLIQPKRRDGASELLGDRLFADVLFFARARASPARTAVVGVLLLLPLRCDLAAAMAAGQQAGKRERAILEVAAAAPAHDRLNLVEQLAGDQGRVLPGHQLALPDELADVDLIAQQAMDRSTSQRLLGVPGDEPRLLRNLLQIGQGILAGGVMLEEAPHQRSLVRVDLEHAPLGLLPVPDRRSQWVVALSRLLVQALSDLLAQVVDVVLGHQHLDAMHELLVRARVLVEDRVLLVEVDRQVVVLHQLVEGDPVLEVPVEPVRLFDNHHALGVLLQELDHLGELTPPRLLGGLHVGELLHDLQAMLQSVGAGGQELGIDGKAFLLLFRADAHVEDSFARPSSLRVLCLGLLAAAGHRRLAPREVNHVSQTGVRGILYSHG